MSKFNDGGPAFPVPGEPYTNGEPRHGMSLHQYFAGLAMQGLSARNASTADIKTVFRNIANASLLMADAMVAAYEEREKADDKQVSITPDMSTLRRAFVAGSDFEYANPRDTKPGGDDEAFERLIKSLLADGMKIKTGTIEVQTAPKGAYEALVYDLAKLLGCDEREYQIKFAIEHLKENALLYECEKIKEIGRKGKM